MDILPLKKIIEIFSKGKSPKGTEFEETWKSFWHKSEKLPIEQVMGLSEEIAKATTNFKGYHTDEAALKAAYPKAENKKDFFAWVGSKPTLIWKVFANGADWENTGKEPTEQEIDLAEYAKTETLKGVVVRTATGELPLTETITDEKDSIPSNFAVKTLENKLFVSGSELVLKNTIPTASSSIISNFTGFYLNEDTQKMIRNREIASLSLYVQQKGELSIMKGVNVGASNHTYEKIKGISFSTTGKQIVEFENLILAANEWLGIGFYTDTALFGYVATPLIPNQSFIFFRDGAWVLSENQLNIGLTISEKEGAIPTLNKQVQQKADAEDKDGKKVLYTVGGLLDLNNSVVGNDVFLTIDSVERSKNWFNKLTVTLGHYGDNYGAHVESTNHITSDFIDVETARVLRHGTTSNEGTGYCYFFDANKKYISTIAENGYINPPANCQFIRVVANITRTPINEFMVVAGNTMPPSYIPYGESTTGKINEKFLPAMAVSKLFNKYVAVGDSNTRGFIPRNHPNTGGQLNSYAMVTGAQIALEFFNYGVDGARLTGDMIDVIDTLPNDADLITIMGGTNDFRGGVQLGTIDDTTKNTYYGALKIISQKLISKYHTDRAGTGLNPATIVWLTPFKLLKDGAWQYDESIQNWVKAVKEVAAYYSIPTLDMNNLSMINPHLDRILQGTNPAGNFNPLIPDGIHLTERGHQLAASVLTGYLRGLK